MKLKLIAVSSENYLALKRLGNAGDSFNDVVTEVLRKVNSPRQQEQQKKHVLVLGGQKDVQ
jgi:predicted CopG family antitoxin